MAHIHEKVDFCVDAFIVFKDKVLIRKHEKYDTWLAVGGHIELDEDPVQAVLREVKEEVGLDIKLWDGNKKYFSGEEAHHHLIPPVGMHRHNVTPTHEHVSMFYLATAATDQVVPEQPNDVWKWFTKEELETADLLPDIKFYTKLALDTLGEN